MLCNPDFSFFLVRWTRKWFGCCVPRFYSRFVHFSSNLLTRRIHLIYSSLLPNHIRVDSELYTLLEHDTVDQADEWVTAFP